MRADVGETGFSKLAERRAGVPSGHLGESLRAVLATGVIARLGQPVGVEQERVADVERERLGAVAARQRGTDRQAARLVEACLADLRGFLAGAAKTDDLTLMVIRRVA